ncbi:MAG: rhomboid family intramembrane serine protease [Spirochaetaceae bacterium]|nr:rhomboid family intramembrane serine protease [Spirochaetaceae bacterium]MBO4727960.1 rhomboid family intramembrane serine protease [Spirochaetaceae bacterium]
MSFSSKIRTPFRYEMWNVTLWLIIINIIVYFLSVLQPALFSYFSLNVINVIYKHAYWQFFTYMFTHGNFQHVFFNMLGLFFFGFSVEKAIGSKEFLLFYLLSGIFCGLVSFAAYYLSALSGNIMAYYYSLLGASGAIYAVLLAYAVIFPRNMIYIFGILPLPAPILVIVYAVIDFGGQFIGSSNVAHVAHLSGFVFAWFYFIVRMGINPWKVWKQNY